MATSTYDLLASTTLATAASSVTFASINQGYGDLIIVISATASADSEYTYGWINGDKTTGNYNYVQMYGSNAGYGSSGQNPYFGQVYTPAEGLRCLNTIQIMDYSATDKQKAMLGRWDVANKQSAAGAVRWASNSAITSIELDHGAGTKTYAAGSTFYLYGVAK
jgi:hypothetical protein